MILIGKKNIYFQIKTLFTFIFFNSFSYLFSSSTSRFIAICSFYASIPAFMLGKIKFFSFDFFLFLKF